MWNLIERGGPWIMLPLLGCSVAALAVVIERIAFWVRIGRARSRGAVEKILELADEGRFEEATEEARGLRDPVAMALLSGIAHRDYDLSSALEMAASAALRRTERLLPVLDTIVTLAPLLGILGTVVGIIGAFEFLSAQAELADPKAVTGGIAQALITTAAGLSIAIASLVPYNYFRTLSDKLLHEIEEAATRLEIVFRRRQAAPPGGKERDRDKPGPSPGKFPPMPDGVEWA